MTNEGPGGEELRATAEGIAADSIMDGDEENRGRSGDRDSRNQSEDALRVPSGRLRRGRHLSH